MKFNSSNPTPSPVLISSVKRVLKPLIGFLMDNGLTLQWLIRLLKEVYVEVAREEFSIDGQELTNSRISLITGVHRKDIASLLSGDGMDDKLPTHTILSARLLSKWVGDPKFSDHNGIPLKLHKTSNKNNEPSFESLVTSVSTDIRAKPILDEWQHLGLINIDQENRITLVKDAFLPNEDHDQKLYFLGKNVSDHLAAARVNTQSDQPPFLERSVYYDQLSSHSLETLEKTARNEGMAMLKRLNKLALDLQTNDKQSLSAPNGGGRMNFGVYYFHQTRRDQGDNDH